MELLGGLRKSFGNLLADNNKKDDENDSNAEDGYVEDQDHTDITLPLDTFPDPSDQLESNRSSPEPLQPTPQPQNRTERNVVDYEIPVLPRRQKAQRVTSKPTGRLPSRAPRPGSHIAALGSSPGTQRVRHLSGRSRTNTMDLAGEDEVQVPALAPGTKNSNLRPISPTKKQKKLDKEKARAEAERTKTATPSRAEKRLLEESRRFSAGMEAKRSSPRKQKSVQKEVAVDDEGKEEQEEQDEGERGKADATPPAPKTYEEIRALAGNRRKTAGATMAAEQTESSVPSRKTRGRPRNSAPAAPEAATVSTAPTTRSRRAARGSTQRTASPPAEEPLDQQQSADANIQTVVGIDEYDQEEEEHEPAAKAVEKRASGKRKRTTAEPAQATKRTQTGRANNVEHDDDESEHEEDENEEEASVEEDSAEAEEPRSLMYLQETELKKAFRKAKEIVPERVKKDPVVKKAIEICDEVTKKLSQDENPEAPYAESTDVAERSDQVLDLMTSIWSPDRDPPRRDDSDVTKQIYERLIPKLVGLLEAFAKAFMKIDSALDSLAREHTFILARIMDMIIDIEEETKKKKARGEYGAPVVRDVRNFIIAGLKKVRDVFETVEKQYVKAEKAAADAIAREEARRIQDEIRQTQLAELEEEREEQRRLDLAEHARREAERVAEMQRVQRQRSQRFKELEEEVEKAIAAKKIEDRIIDKWNSLHQTRINAEGGYISMSRAKMKHLENPQPILISVDHNGMPFVPEQMIKRLGPTPEMLNDAFERRLQWTDEQVITLEAGLREYHGIHVFEIIFENFCKRGKGPGSILNPFNVTEIVSMAEVLKRTLVIAFRRQVVPVPDWVLAIPVWTGSQASRRSANIFGEMMDLEVEVDDGDEESQDEAERPTENRPRDRWDDLMDGVETGPVNDRRRTYGL